MKGDALMTAGRSINTQSVHWCTPEKYKITIEKFFNGNIDLDPCSNYDSIINAKNKFILPIDGLKEEWNYKNIYVNPPYGRSKNNKTTIKDWIRKCYEANKKYKSEVLALIPVATNTSHWKEYIFNKATAVCFLYDTRLKFRIDGNENNKGCPMACCMVYWGNNYNKFLSIYSGYGSVVKLIK